MRTLLDGRDPEGGPRRKTALVAHELDRYNIDIAALSETRLSGEGCMVEGERGHDYTIYWRGYPSGEPRMHGVGLAIRSQLLRGTSEEPTYVNERLMYLKMRLVKNEHATVIAAYAPTLAADTDDKDQFYDQLDAILRSINRKDKIILLGDFNARVGTRRDLWDGVIGQHGVGKMNENGLRLLSLCSQHSLCITNTMFRMRNKYKTSWMHPRSKQWHLIDYIIVRASQLSEVTITRAMRGAECWTDHRLIVAKMHLKIRPPVRKKSCRNVMLNCSSLKVREIKDQYQMSVERLVHETAEIDHSSNWDGFASKLLELAEDIVGTKKKRDRDWFAENSAVIREILKVKNMAHQACIRNPTSTFLREEFSKIRSETQRKLRGIENQWWQNISREIQGYADVNNMQMFYDATKRIYGPTRRTSVPVRDSDGTLIKEREGVLARWAEHFSILLNNITDTDQSVLDELPDLTTFAELDDIPTIEEVARSVSSLKNNKAAGPDSIPAELLVNGGPALHGLLHRILVKIWETCSVPQSWKDAILITIYKNKGDRAECGNSRGIALLSAIGKVLARILLIRLVAKISEDLLPESQCGFRANRSTVDMIFATRQVMEKCREQRRDLYIAFVDLSKAFDSVDRELLWSVLKKCGCPNNFVAVVKQLHEGMQVRVRVVGDLSEPFEVSRGVKQGCVLAPVLFNIYLYCITYLLTATLRGRCSIDLCYRFDRSLFDLSKLKAKSKVSCTSFRELQYADDCALVAHSATELQEILNVMCHYYKRMGLNINVKKTEVMRYTVSPTEYCPIIIDNSQLKEVNNFRYLGSHLSSDCGMDDEIVYRVSQANSAFGRLRERVFDNRNLSLETKVMVYQAVCLSALLYGSESWTLYRRQTKILERYHIRCLQIILGISYQDRVPHSAILKRAESVSIECLLKRSQLRWVGHVVRMPNNRLPKQLLYGELATGSRTTGGQLLRFKDNVKKTLKACNIDSSRLEESTMDRDGWRSLVKTSLMAFEDKRHRWLNERRERRHKTPNTTTQTGPTFECSTCGRVCASRIGLHSHVAAHQRRELTARQAVIVEPDGQP